MIVELSTHVNYFSDDFKIEKNDGNKHILVSSSKYDKIEVTCPVPIRAYSMSYAKRTKPDSVEFEETNGKVVMQIDGDQFYLRHIVNGEYRMAFLTFKLPKGSVVLITDNSCHNCHEITI